MLDHSVTAVVERCAPLRNVLAVAAVEEVTLASNAGVAVAVAAGVLLRFFSERVSSLKGPSR